MRVKQASVQGRGTQGVRLIVLDNDDLLSSVTKLVEKPEEDGTEHSDLSAVPPPSEGDDESKPADNEE